MDKYFASGYDPRLDVGALPLPAVPATGLVGDAEFAGWEAMLDVIRQRREDREERRRGGEGKGREKKGKEEDVKEGVDIMAIEYKKRGAVREWDLGKEGF